MKKALLSLVILACVSPLVAQDLNQTASEFGPWPGDQLSIGLGMGLDHGGFGGNLNFYPVKNVGLFGGVGYALAGVGFNAGARFRLIPGMYDAKVHPFAIVMYGYNAAISISNRTDLNKLFYGPSVGVGLDFHRNHLKRGYWSFAVLLPIRKAEVNEYMDMLETNYGVDFSNKLFPIAISIGYKIIIL